MALGESATDTSTLARTELSIELSERAFVALLEAVILRAMARDTGMRHRTADELCSDLRAAVA